MTLRQRMMKALELRGERPVPSRSSKYLCYTHTIKRTDTQHPFGQQNESYYWLGRSGALRVGRISSNTVPVSDKFKELLLKLADKEKEQTNKMEDAAKISLKSTEE